MATSNYCVYFQVTWADFQLALALDLPSLMAVEIDYTKLPKLKEVLDNVNNIPSIKAWIERRPA